jgi:hypothetical protein
MLQIYLVFFYKVKKQSKVKCDAKMYFGKAQHFGVHFPKKNVQQRKKKRKKQKRKHFYISYTYILPSKNEVLCIL